MSPITKGLEGPFTTRWSSLGPGSEKKWCSTLECKPQGEWERVAEKMLLTFAESKHPVFRSTSPLSRRVLKSKGGGKLSIHFCADGDTIETVFRTIISVNQLSIYGAVADVSDEYSNMLWKDNLTHFFAPSVMKTHIHLTDDPSQQEEDLLQRYMERIEKLSQQDRVSKFCADAGFLTAVEVGQYFMTKDNEKLSITIHRRSGLSWEHTAKRWKVIWTKRLDSREH